MIGRKIAASVVGSMVFIMVMTLSAWCGFWYVAILSILLGVCFIIK